MASWHRRRYEATGGCYPGATWATGLSNGTRTVACGGFRFGWNARREFWRIVVPRTCLRRMTDGIRVESYVMDYSPTPGEVALTPRIARG